MATTITTGKVRLSFAHLFVPTAMNEGDEKKYSTTLLIPKTDKVTLNAINTAMKEAIEENKGKKWGGKVPAKWENPLRDGDEEKSDNEEYVGMYFINVKNTKQPKVVDRARQEILDADEVYSGCFGRANISFFLYNFNQMKKGVSASINAFQKLEDGDRLSGFSGNVDDMFDDENDDL